MLGVSTYLQEYQPDYLEQAARAGARLVFTSLQMPELDYDHAKPVLTQVLEQCRELGMSLVADVSPAAFSLLHVAEGDYDALRALGVDTIRLDYGFRDLRLVRDLQRRFRLVLNASVVSDAYLDEAVAEGVRLEDLSFMHNYYPRAETGLSREGFERANELFRRRGLSVQAFVRGTPSAGSRSTRGCPRSSATGASPRSSLPSTSFAPSACATSSWGTRVHTPRRSGAWAPISIAGS